MQLSLYTVLIAYFVFLVFKKILDFYLEIEVPTYEDLQKSSKSIQNIFKLRDIFTIISISFIFFIATFYKINTYITVILFILFINALFYFLIEKRYIYYIIDKNKLDISLIHNLDKYYGRFSALALSLYCLYVIINIFYKNK